MISLGIDQGLGKATGYSVMRLEDNKAPVIVKTYLETFAGMPVEDVPGRLRYFFHTTKAIIKEHNPQIIVTELPFHFHGYSDSATNVVSQLNGVLLLLKPEHTIAVLINVASWQARIGLSKRPEKRTKDKSIALIDDLFGVTVSDHEADASCLNLVVQSFLEETNRDIARIYR